MPKQTKTTNKGSAKSKSKVRKPTKRVGKIKAVRPFRFSPCAMKYLAACANGFLPKATGACTPTFPTRTSQKMPIVNRFSVAAGTSGIGFVAISPCTSNDSPVAWCSTSTFAGTSASWVSTGPGTTSTVGVTSVLAASPYNSTQLGPNSYDSDVGQTSGTLTRMVSCTARVTYTGELLKRGGNWAAYVSPNHGNLAGSTMASLGARREPFTGPITEKTVYLSTCAVNSTELQYGIEHVSTGAGTGFQYKRPHVNPFSMGYSVDAASETGNWFNGACPMVFMFATTPGNTFWVEIISHVEFTSGPAAPFGTVSHSDPIGLSAIQQAVDRANDFAASTKPDYYAERLYQLADGALTQMSNIGYEGARFMRSVNRNMGLPDTDPYMIEL